VMNKFSLFIYISFATFMLQAQIYTGTNLDNNSVNIRVENNGMLFKHSYNNNPGYEVIKGENTKTISATSFWFGGLDEDDNLHGSFTLFTGNTDIFSGPYSSNGSYFDPDYATNYYNKIWKVSREEIIYHIDNYTHPNYLTPEGIAEWPGNGINSIGVAEQLAPFVDVDGDGIYNPENGDYPCIKGDEAVYFIVNDDELPKEYGVESIGIEVHFMLYQFTSNDFADSTTFLNAKIYNRGGVDYTDFKTSIVVESGIGYPYDDFMGCDTTKNLGYAYNASNEDMGLGSSEAFGVNPPAMGTLVLNDTLRNFGRFMNPHNFEPWLIAESTFWSFMNSQWPGLSNFVVGGSGVPGTLGATTQATNYLFSGNPYIDEGWTEMNNDGNGTMNPDGLRYYFMTISAENFNANEVLEYDYAFLYSRVGNHLENVQGVIDLANIAQTLYDDSLAIMNCEVQGTGIMDSIPSPTVNTLPNPQLLEITRLDGIGNMQLPLSIHSSSEWQILAQNEVDSIRYRRGGGPIYVERYDTINYQEGYYVIKILEDDVDNSNWRIYRFDQQGGQILDSVDAGTTLLQGDTIVLTQYGLKIAIKQHKYSCDLGQSSCSLSHRLAIPTHTNLSFSDTNTPWLTGVKNNLGFNPENWIRSGVYSTFGNQANLNLGYNNPQCYTTGSGIIKDVNYLYSNLLDGIIAPANFTRFSDCGFNPVQVPGHPLFSEGAYRATLQHFQNTQFHPSIDIVFTPDTNLWTRCPVIELNNDSLTSIGTAKPGLLRQSPSVDKNGNVDTSGTVGMSWFPGYAIDVESGRRLNMAFGENSTLVNDNGTDMIWNPSNRLFDTNGNPVFGGQHAIYVFGGTFDDMPNYDQGEYIHDKLSNPSTNSIRDVYKNLSWVMQPILEDGYNLLDCWARVEVRINKEFQHYPLSGANESRPMFGFKVEEYMSNFTSVQEYSNVPSSLLLFPNPANNQLSIQWENIETENILLYSMEGKLIYSFAELPNSKELIIDVAALNPGIYIVRKGTVAKRFMKQ
jgi:hypothetical protein